ncbi:CLIP-associating protein 1-like isoform X4 [Portunus trituberculatus]|uniref:CLIP-associating protein 1-like isoform X4 n=1 Tax=Portunus trituberculatus TaxID=210409 RepID=UPI001E1CF80E|nr:CLIP-associating protein 1-like isoform X4 [Portunus trituberculatus]
MPSVSPTGPNMYEGSPPPPVSPATSMELGGSFTSQCSVESLGSLDSGHSSSADNGPTDSQTGTPSPGAHSPALVITSPSTCSRARDKEGNVSFPVSLASMGCQDRPPSRIDRSLSNTSTTSVTSDMSMKSTDTVGSSTTVNSDQTGATSTSSSSTTIVTPIKTKEELDSYIDHLDSLWSEEDEWIMIFDNLIKNTEASTRTRRHTHHHSHHHTSGSTSYHSSPYQSPYKAGKGDDDVDRASRSLPRRILALRRKVKSGGSKSRASSAPPVRRTVQGAALPPKSAGGESGVGPRSTIKRVPSISRGRVGSSSSNTAAAGAVDEASFFALFEDVPKVTIYSHKELEDTLTKVREVIASSSNDWDKRVDALKKIRSLIIAGAASYEEFYPHLRLLEPAMQLSIKDLRSQVVREACVTVAYMSQELHHKVDHLCETLLPSLIILIPNSAKIMASSGIVTIRFIIQNTHHHKLIPILLRELSSKNREIRKVLCEVLDQLVHTWPTHSMEKHIVILSESIKKGITDADPEARAFSRK